MRVQVASDLHLEHWTTHPDAPCHAALLASVLQPCAPYLVLAGDVGDPFSAAYEAFLHQACQAYQRVFLVPGNHEYYSPARGPTRSMADVDARLDQLQRCMGGTLEVLRCRSVVVGDVRVVGATMWSHCPPAAKDAVQRGMSDYRHIHLAAGRQATVEDTNAWFKAAVVFLYDEVIRARAAGQRVLVVTHHLPSMRCVAPRFAGSPLNHAFATSLDHLLESGLVSAWVFGHTQYGVPPAVQPGRLPSGHRSRGP